MLALHHREVVSAHNSVLEVLLGKELGPTVVREIGTVVEQPLHGSWVLSLTWWGTGVLRVGAHTICAPDGKDRRSDLGVHWLRVIVLEVLDCGREVRKEPGRSATGLTGTEKTYLVEKDVETGR